MAVAGGGVGTLAEEEGRPRDQHQPHHIEEEARPEAGAHCLLEEDDAPERRHDRPAEDERGGVADGERGERGPPEEHERPEEERAAHQQQPQVGGAAQDVEERLAKVRRLLHALSVAPAADDEREQPLQHRAHLHHEHRRQPN
eukprot:401085-Prymnesium_polylepis.1